MERVTAPPVAHTAGPREWWIHNPADWAGSLEVCPTPDKCSTLPGQEPIRVRELIASAPDLARRVEELEALLAQAVEVEFLNYLRGSGSPREIWITEARRVLAKGETT